MCGIGGLFDLRGTREVSPVRLGRINALSAHRGPDGSGDFLASGIGLTHRRLAIIDRAGGHQPLFNETGQIALVFNGEIYNFQDLSAELRRCGHQFRTRSDTEVIVHAWEEWGPACVEHFRGMFAFALWDADQRALFLARDRLGEKPLYYTETADGWLVFASELRAAASALEELPPLEPQAVEDYFAYGYVPDPKTIYRGLYKLAPGHRLVVRAGQPVVPAPYWDLHFAGTETPAPAGAGSLVEAAEELTHRLDQAVRLRLVAEVPLGVFLSGGVDSSGITALTALASDHPVQTCSIAFGDPRFDESRYAHMVAERYHTDHFSETVEVDACDLIDRLSVVYSEPFADASALPTYLVCQLARRRVTVALSGDGGDELFAGYRRHAFHYREEQLKSWLPAGLRRQLLGPLARLYPRLDWAPRPLRAKATLEALSGDAVEGYFRAVTLLPTAERLALYSGDFRRELGGYQALEVLRDHAGRAGTDDPLARVQYLDVKTWLPGGMLTKVDRASMAHGLEVRPPLLDHQLAEWAAGLPVRFKLHGGSGKAVLKQALAPYLPPELLNRPKQGFSPPLAHWLRHGLRERLAALSESNAPLLATGLFEPAVIAGMVARHQSGRHDHARPLWSLLMFEAFLRRLWLNPTPETTA